MRHPKPGPRPLSPHLQIYRPQITSVLSALHRLTGIALATGILFLVAWFATAAAGPDLFACTVAVVTHPVGIALLAAGSWTLFFHACNGVRHLCWDAGWGFDLRTVTASGWSVLAAATVITLILWLWIAL